VLVFPRGVGENQLEIRSGAAAGLGFLGVALDESASAAGERDRDISARSANARTLFVRARGRRGRRPAPPRAASRVTAVGAVRHDLPAATQDVPPFDEALLSWLGDEPPRCALLAAERQYYCQVKPRLGADEARARESEAAGMVNERNRVSSLPHARVSDRTHVGILSRASDAPLAQVAGIKAERIDAVAVTDHEGAWPVGVVSDLDVVAAAVGGTEPSALQAAATEPLAVSVDASLRCAAQLMAEHGVAHLVVLDAASGYPVGVLSTLDIAAAYAGVAG
jgi:hypothetical protein